MAKYCVRCGRKNPNNVSVCNGCGTPLDGNSVEPELFTNIELEETSVMPEQQVEQLNNQEVENTEIQKKGVFVIKFYLLTWNHSIISGTV